MPCAPIPCASSRWRASDPAFVLQATVAQPPGFVELISVLLNNPEALLEIVSQRTLDAYGAQSLGRIAKIAISGTNFRVKDDPAGATATLRYYQKLATPSGAIVNAILTGYPDVYLFGCLIEAAIFTQDELGAQRYLQLYNASVAGLNARTQRITALGRSGDPPARGDAAMTLCPQSNHPSFLLLRERT